MSESYQVRPRVLAFTRKPVRDPLYLRFIKKLPCAACLKTWSVDPCHTGPHGIGQKSCDLSCIPLCRKHHQEFDSDPRGFAERFNLDITALIAKFNASWRRITEKRAA